MSAITAKASRKMKKYAVLTREPRCFLGSFDFSWEQRKVQDVADRFDNLRIPVAANLRVHGTTPYYGANGIQDYVEGFTHDGEFVLVAEDGANDLKNYPVKCVNGRIWVNNHAHVLQGKAGISDNSFLAFAISQSDIESLLVGGSRAKLNAETLMSIEFKLPCLQEQYRIGEYLTQLDHLITLHQRKCANLCSPSQVVFSLLFATSTFSWEQRKLGDISEIKTGPFGSSLHADDYVSDGTPIITTEHFKTGALPRSKNGLPQVSDSDYKRLTAYTLDAGDIVFSRVGSVDINALITPFQSNWLFSGRVLRVRPQTDVSSQFLHTRLETESIKTDIRTRAVGQTMPSINTEILKITPLVLPSSVAEQEQIGSYFAALDNLITLHQRECISFTGRADRLILTANKKRTTSSWEQRKLSEITDKVTEKNAGLQYVETFTNSAEFGIISQRDFFDHDIAKLGSLDGYYIVKNEDFVYNPRISTSAPVGPINRNKLGRTGVMSPLYTVFRPHDIDTTYLEYFFKCGYWHSFMNFNGDSGARSDRFSIRDNVFFQMPIPIPDIDEQRKIGELLTCLDNLITLHQRKPFLMKWRTSDANRNQTNRLVL